MMLSIAPLITLAMLTTDANADDAVEETTLILAQSDDDSDDDDDDDDDFDIDSLIQENSEPMTNKEEKDAVAAPVEDQVDDIIREEERRQIIKTLQRKTFVKGFPSFKNKEGVRVRGLNRWEISPHVSGVVNDPFLNRGYAGVGIGYHLTEVFGIESMIDVGFPFSQCLEASAEGAQAQCPDDSGLTENLLDYNSVVPDISRIIYMGDLGLTYSPIYGKAAVLGKNIINFDLFGRIGMGFVNTQDDVNLLAGNNQSTESGGASEETTVNQFHATTTYGGGARVIFNENIAARLEGRGVSYIETVESSSLEMKNNFLVQGSVSIFFPMLKN